MISFHSSDLCQPAENIATQGGPVGYRNVVSYVAALGLPVLPRTAMDKGTAGLEPLSPHHPPLADRIWLARWMRSADTSWSLGNLGNSKRQMRKC